MGEVRKGLHPLTKLIRERPYSARVRVMAVLKDTNYMLTRAAVVLGVSKRRMTQVIHELGLYAYVHARRAERHELVEQRRYERERRRWALNGKIRERSPEGGEVRRERRRKWWQTTGKHRAAAGVPPVGHAET